MFVVAITRLDTPADVEAQALAGDLGSTAYESRLLLNQGLPAIVLSTKDRDRALDMLGRLRARRHGAVAIDSTAVTGSHTMPSLRRFGFTEEGVLRDDAAPDLLPFDDILALVRATHRARVETSVQVKEKQFSLGRAALTGGISVSKTVTKSHTESTELREGVLYLFRRGGAPPWILRTEEARYAGLGPHLKAATHLNFMETIRLLRERAPTARYDERLVRYKGGESVARVGAGSHSHVMTSSEGSVDLMAHLVALLLRDEARSSG